MLDLLRDSRPMCRLFSTLRSLFLGLMVCVLAACSPQKITVVSGPIMGTQYRISLNCPKVKQTAEQLQTIAVKEMNAVNDSMSTYQADSELSLFNKQQSTDWQPASDALLEVLAVSASVYSTSGGAFDPTVSKLIDLWGFGAGSKKTLERVLPTQAELEAAADTIGFDKLIIDKANKRIKKQLADLNVDLSAVAKGYAVDRVSQALVDTDCDNHLVDIGGELKGTGVNDQGLPWRVGVEKPVLNAIKGAGVQKLISLNNGLASSGDYRNYYEKNGKRFSHTIDPRTYKPIDHTLASVTVVHESTAVADAWATALMVLGDKAFALAESIELSAYFIFRDENNNDSGRFITKSTKQFDKFTLSK